MRRPSKGRNPPLVPRLRWVREQIAILEGWIEEESARVDTLPMSAHETRGGIGVKRCTATCPACLRLNKHFAIRSSARALEKEIVDAIVRQAEDAADNRGRKNKQKAAENDRNIAK